MTEKFKVVSYIQTRIVEVNVSSEAKSEFIDSILKGGITMMHGLYIRQDGQNYSVYTAQGIQIALIYLGNDKQYMEDAVTMKMICKVLAKRWGITADQSKS